MHTGPGHGSQVGVGTDNSNSNVNVRDLESRLVGVLGLQSSAGSEQKLTVRLP